MLGKDENETLIGRNVVERHPIIPSTTASLGSAGRGPLRPGRLAMAMIFVAACVPAPKGPSLPERPAVVRSNIERADYAGSQACASCHRAYFDAFMASPMHNMTRLPARTDLRGIFAGRIFRFKQDSVILEEREGRPCMRIGSRRFGDHLFRVTKVIGGHHREDFAGVEAGSRDTLTERILPVSFFPENKTFRYKGYSVMDPERPALKAGAVWNQTCLFCHNTVPYLSTILRELAGPEAPPFQGSDVDRSLPANRRESLKVADSLGLRNALAAEIDFLRRAGGSGVDRGSRSGSLIRTGSLGKTARKALNATWSLFNGNHLVEIGIGCESCHGGSREHAADPRIRTSLTPRSPYLSVSDPEPPKAAERRQQITRACARCHQVLFTGYPWTWEGAARGDSLPGGAHINSGEGRDLLLSDCRITCTDCHNPHAPDNDTRMGKLDGPEGNLACTSCHGALASPAAVKDHSHHDPVGAGGLCLNCHMPRKNMTLDTRLGRYHRIASPTDRIKVEGDRPLECALCHGGKPIGELVDTLESWWGKHYDRGKLTDLYGDLRQGSILATLRNGKPHEKAVALGLAALPLPPGVDKKELIPLVAAELADPYPLVRYYADHALAELIGRESPLDLHGETDSLMRATSGWLRSAGY